MSYNHGTISFRTVGGRTWDDDSKLLYTIDTGTPW